MNLFTEVKIENSKIKIDYSKNLFFAGSCFAENISQFFKNAKFNCMVNPSGIVYNPLSFKMMIDNVLAKRKYDSSDFFYDGTNYNCFDFHSSFSNSDLQLAVDNVNKSYSLAYDFLKTTDVFFITLGTAFVYFLTENSQPVSNCHKQNPKIFERRLISVAQVSDALSKIIQKLTEFNPKIHFVFTVSPIRHFSDGAHNNQLSKSSLHLGIQEVLTKFDNCEYFPSYEIVNDELRDYRFYADDMIHVSKIAEQIIWQKIQEAYFSDKIQQQILRVQKFMLSVNHKIQNPESEQTKKFCEKNILSARSLMSEIQGLNLEKEIEYFSRFCC